MIFDEYAKSPFNEDEQSFANSRSLIIHFINFFRILKLVWNIKKRFAQNSKNR